MSWVDDIEDFFEEVKPPEHLKCVIVLYKMEGAAYLWWKKVLTDRFSEGKNMISSWSRMRKLLISKFAPRHCSTEGLLEVHGSNNFEENNACRMVGDHHQTAEFGLIEASIEGDECSSEKSEFSERAALDKHAKQEAAEVIEGPQTDKLMPAKCSTEVPSESYSSKWNEVRKLELLNYVDVKLKLDHKVTCMKNRLLPIVASVLPSKGFGESIYASNIKNLKLSHRVGSNIRLEEMVWLTRVVVILKLYLDGNKHMTSLIFGEYMGFNSSITEVVSFLFDPGGVPLLAIKGNFGNYLSFHFCILLDCTIQRVVVGTELLSIKICSALDSCMMLRGEIAKGNVLCWCLWPGNALDSLVHFMRVLSLKSSDRIDGRIFTNYSFCCLIYKGSSWLRGESFLFQMQVVGAVDTICPSSQVLSHVNGDVCIMDMIYAQGEHGLVGMFVWKTTHSTILSPKSTRRKQSNRRKQGFTLWGLHEEPANGIVHAFVSFDLGGSTKFFRTWNSVSYCYSNTCILFVIISCEWVGECIEELKHSPKLDTENCFEVTTKNNLKEFLKHCLGEPDIYLADNWDFKQRYLFCSNILTGFEQLPSNRVVDPTEFEARSMVLKRSSDEKHEEKDDWNSGKRMKIKVGKRGVNFEIKLIVGKDVVELFLKNMNGAFLSLAARAFEINGFENLMFQSWQQYAITSEGDWHVVEMMLYTFDLGGCGSINKFEGQLFPFHLGTEITMELICAQKDTGLDLPHGRVTPWKGCTYISNFNPKCKDYKQKIWTKAWTEWFIEYMAFVVDVLVLIRRFIVCHQKDFSLGDELKVEMGGSYSKKVACGISTQKYILTEVEVELNVVTFSSLMEDTWKDRWPKRALRLFHNMLNGLDPPMDLDDACETSTWSPTSSLVDELFEERDGVDPRVRSWTSFLRREMELM